MEEKKRKTYRNFTRSERAIIRAYVELMHEKRSGKITVTDIVNKADLNRSTFYAHFKASDDVREKIHADVVKGLMEAMEKSDYRNSLSSPKVVLWHILDFLRKDEEVYKMLLRTEGASSFLRDVEDAVVDKYMTDQVMLPKIKDKDEFEMVLRLFIGGFISVLQDWARDEIKIPLERVIELTERSIRRVSERYILNKEY